MPTNAWQVREGKGQKTPRLHGGTSNERQAMSLSCFNSTIADDPVRRLPIDIFGNLIGRVVPPDEKMPPEREWQSPRVARQGRVATGLRSSKAWEGVELRRSRGEAVVVMQPELGDLANPKGDMHKHAKDIALENIPSLVKSVAEVEAKELYNSVEMPDGKRQRFGQSSDGEPAFPTPRFRGPVIIPPRQNVQANPDGILPPNSARHDARSRVDKHYSVRQAFPLRKSCPPSQEAGFTVRVAPQSPAEKDEMTDGTQLDIEYRDYGAAPTLPADQSRRGVRKSIRSKLHWGRFEQVGRDLFVKRSQPNKVAVAESRHKSPEKDYNREMKAELQDSNYAVKKFLRIAANASKEKEKNKTVQERRSVLRHEREQWLHSLAEKYDEELRLQAVLAQEQMRRQGMWAAIQAHVRSLMTFQMLIARGRQINSKQTDQIESCIAIQTFVRMKMRIRRERQFFQQIRELIRKVKPYFHFMIIRWRARRKAMMTDRLRFFLNEVLKSNQVKRRISHYIYNVRRLQNAWRHHLRRQKARMLVLSRQWDRAFLLMRSKGKHGRLHDQSEMFHAKRAHPVGHFGVSSNSTTSPPKDHVHSPTKEKLQPKWAASSNSKRSLDGMASLPEGKKVAFKTSNKLTIDTSSFSPGASSRADTATVRTTGSHVQSLSHHRGPQHGSFHISHMAHGPYLGASPRGHHHFPLSEWERRLQDHNTIHVPMVAKQLSMLSRIVHYPAIKWQRLRSVLRSRRMEHIANVKQYKNDLENFMLFTEQKRTVEQVIIAFAPDEDGGREMAKKLLGELVSSEMPKFPRNRTVMPAAEMQKYIALGLERLMQTSGQLRQEAANAEAFLRESLGDKDGSPVSAVISVHHHRPWWVAHETLWHTFHADPHQDR